ncbi:MAG: sodium:proton antiporter [Phycisphaeraceae bacterium]|nr:sodium:proton antiporter [Phycisphaeraceae bacterium]
MSGDSHSTQGFHGPKAWVVSLAAGLVLGWILSLVAPARYSESPEHGAPPPTAGHGLVGGDSSPRDDAAHPDGFELAAAGDPEDGSTVGFIPADESSVPANDDVEAAHHEQHGAAPTIPLWLVVPFAALLLSIALMPFISARIWHQHFPDFAFFLGGVTLGYYLIAFSQPGYAHGMPYGAYMMKHTGLEYYQFIALIGSLFVASGGILIDVRGRGRPIVNTGILAFGAVVANIIGTTGASVLLVRPFMRVNKGRLRPMHVVMFIFIVSNCGGCLTPIGDPPLYLGFLKGVPFMWTLTHLWPAWLLCVGLLLAVFFVIDLRTGPGDAPDDGQAFGVSIKGFTGLLALALIIVGVFVDPFLKARTSAVEGIPVGATLQIAVAIGAYLIADRHNHEANEFNFFPVKEVGLLFIGIFATMAPALGYLSEHGAQLGLDSPAKFYFATGSLSAMLDNAPTYLNFLQVAFAANGLTLNADNVHAFLATPFGMHELEAISLGAVFFGAMTYIGNGPNFMVRAIAETGGLDMPSFFGYVLRAVVVLLPILAIVWLVFIL